MPATKPQRPAPGIALALPRVSDEDSQRAFDHVSTNIRQLQSKLGSISTSVIELTGSSTWVNAASFGAKGDGNDSTLALQTAINETQGRTLYLPRGKYVVSSTLTISDRSHHIVGDLGNRHTDGGTEIVYTGTGPCIQIGRDTGVDWDANFYGGPQDHRFENLWISHGAPDTLLVGSGNTSSYKAGAFGIWDWYSGQLVVNGIGLEHFEANFAGVQSDINNFNYVISLYSKYGIYLGPRSDQNTIRDLYSFFCDRAITIDRAAGTRILDAQIVGCGTSTSAGIEVRRGSTNVCIHRPWFEHLQGYAGTDQLAFVSAGITDGYSAGGSISSSGGTPTTVPVEGLSIEHPFVYTTAAGQANHTKCIAAAGRCRRLELHHPNAPPGVSLGNFDAFVAVPATQAPTNTETQVRITGTDSSVGVTQCFQNLGAGAPTISIWGTGPSGLTFFDNVTLGAVSGNFHTLRGQTTVVAPPGTTNGVGLAGTQANTEQTVGTVAVRGRQEGTYDTTAGILLSVGTQGQSISTRSAGANTLRNIGVQGTASGGQDNRALETVDGDCHFNITSGMSRFYNSVRGPGAVAAAPATGTYAQGDIIFNADPVVGGFIGWVCTVAGTPGTWKSWGAISP